MSTFSCNLASLLLGLTAWILPLVYLGVRKRRDLFCSASFAAAALSLFFQLQEPVSRMNRGDISGIIDTLDVLPAVYFCACVMLCVTLILNIIAFLRKER